MGSSQNEVPILVPLHSKYSVPYYNPEPEGARSFQINLYGWLSQLWLLFGSLVQYGTYYSGYPKRDHNFDNHLYIGDLSSVDKGPWRGR